MRGFIPDHRIETLVSELRQDIVSGAWVVIATGRAKRPHEFLKQKRVPFKQPKAACPFEKIHPDAIAVYSLDGKKERRGCVEVIPNKFPAFGKGICAFYHKVGPYQWTEGVGFQDLVITRDHNITLAQMSDREVEVVARAYQDRYLALKDSDCVEYISIFHNHGRESGATVSHPHSQIIAIPVIPPDVERSLRGSANYFHEHKTCVHCVVLKYELKTKDRIVYQNDKFAVITPFASKTAFEMRIFPKRHSPHFEEMERKDRFLFANALRSALAKLFYGLKNPDYNFFLHTAPVGDEKEFHHYHWHFEILPKTAIWAGFEIGTGIDISAIAPEAAAKFLRGIRV